MLISAEDRELRCCDRDFNDLKVIGNLPSVVNRFKINSKKEVWDVDDLVAIGAYDVNIQVLVEGLRTCPCTDAQEQLAR